MAQWFIEEYRAWPWSTRLCLPVWFVGLPASLALRFSGWPHAEVVLLVAALAFVLNLLFALIFDV